MWWHYPRSEPLAQNHYKASAIKRATAIASSATASAFGGDGNKRHIQTHCRNSIAGRNGHRIWWHGIWRNWIWRNGFRNRRTAFVTAHVIDGALRPGPSIEVHPRDTGKIRTGVDAGTGRLQMIIAIGGIDEFRIAFSKVGFQG